MKGITQTRPRDTRPNDENIPHRPVKFQDEVFQTFGGKQHQHIILDTNHVREIKSKDSKNKALLEPLQYCQENDEDGDDLAAAFYEAHCKPKNQQNQRQKHEALISDWVTIIPGLKVGDLEAPNGESDITKQLLAFQMMSAEEEDLLELAARYRVEIKNDLTKLVFDTMQDL